VFSTGPEIPDTRLSGTVTSRTTGKTELATRVEAIHRSDSLVYAILTDSAGAFNFTRIPPGEYRVRAFRDLNTNRALDPFEARDTTVATVAVGRPAAVRLRVLQPDSTAPRIASVQLADSAVEVRFDDFLDPVQRITPGQVDFVLPGGGTIAAARVQVSSPAGAAAGGAPTGAPTGANAAARADSAAPAPPQEPIASQSLFVWPSHPLPSNTEVTVRVRDVWNVNGLVGGGEKAFRIPAAPAAPARTPPAPAPATTPPAGPPPTRP
ncbi:MAG: hypothetical protein JO040_06395, partial [Gemmatimonadetes bacterium]|nr:hypothetical protein [Gemmatimonadota bacterium]